MSYEALNGKDPDPMEDDIDMVNNTIKTVADSQPHNSLRWLATVFSTFQILEFDGSL